jgi:hypothetical protein
MKRPTLVVLPSGRIGRRQMQLPRVTATNKAFSSTFITSPFGLGMPPSNRSSRPLAVRR